MRSEFQQALAAIVGDANVLTDERDTAGHFTDWRKQYRGAADCVVRPADTREVAAVVKLCARERVAIVPQGGNTGLSGGATPTGTRRELVLSLGRMNRIREIDPLDDSLVAEAGCILANVQQAAETAGRYFPVSLAAEGSCQVGGILSTNAGGVNVLRYGNTRDQVLGLRGRPRRRQRLERPAQPAQGQHRVRPEASFHRRRRHPRHHHRSRAQAPRRAFGQRDRVDRARDAGAGGRVACASCARSSASA
jgi:FAD/FMN-containing dehydrogenase